MSANEKKKEAPKRISVSVVMSTGTIEVVYDENGLKAFLDAMRPKENFVLNITGTRWW